MSFTCLKCAKCQAGYISVITHINTETKTITTGPIKRGKCDDSCLSDDEQINRGQHYVALNLWRHNKELNRKMFPRGREAAVEELEKKIEEARCKNQENKS